MTPDPRWLEILKASGWQTAALAVASGLFLLAAHSGLLPPLEPWMTLLAAAGLLLFGCLAVASFLSTFFEFVPVQNWLLHWITIQRQKRAARDYIPHMTPKERQIPAGEKSEGVHLRQRWRLCDHAPFGRDPGARLEERADVRHGRHAGGGACSHLGRAACAQRPISVQAREGRAGSGSASVARSVDATLNYEEANISRLAQTPAPPLRPPGH